MTADLKVNKLETVGVWCPSLSDVQFQFQQMALITSSMCSIDIDNGNLLERPIGGPGHLFPWEAGLPLPARRRIMHMCTINVG